MQKGGTDCGIHVIHNIITIANVSQWFSIDDFINYYVHV